MPELDQALAILTEMARDRPCGTERVDLLDALRRVLGEDVVSDIDRLPFHESTRDGFACRRIGLGNDLEVVETGETVLHAGEIVKARHIAVLAEVGCCRPLVSRRPTVGVIATGSELVEPDYEPGPGQIRNSNSFQLSAMVVSASAVPRNYGLVPDDREAIRAALNTAMAENDVVVLSGGISRGDFDLVRDILEENVTELLFDRVGAAPGRPVLFGVSDDAFCFGLSGNPLSNFIMFELIVRPFLYAMAGHRFRPVIVRGELAEPMHRRRSDKDLWLPVVPADDGRVRPIECSGSRGVHAMCKASGMVHVPAGVAGFPKGTTVVVRAI